MKSLSGKGDISRPVFFSRESNHATEEADVNVSVARHVKGSLTKAEGGQTLQGRRSRRTSTNNGKGFSFNVLPQGGHMAQPQRTLGTSGSKSSPWQQTPDGRGVWE